MRKADNLPPSCGNLNFLETSGPVQACNGIALPLPVGLTSGVHSGRSLWLANYNG